ncbi:MAG TPA: hypothetical protein VMI54_13170 [Polyangiaceae bacterium]|nr:hypothetical protein [Polyangiaceae bacterium]
MRTLSVGALVFTAFCAAACSAEQSAAVAPKTAAPARAEAPPAELAAVSPVERHVGDFVVHVVSGTFRKEAAVFTERVLAREGDGWVMEYKLEDNSGARSLRATVDANGEVTRVALLDDGDEKPGTLADYEAFMALANLAPDENDGLVATSRGTCMVGPSELDCETKNYRVMLGDKEASLGITGSHAVPGLDLAGEITTPDGTVIYRSVLIERGNEANEHDDDSFALVDHGSK